MATLSQSLLMLILAGLAITTSIAGWVWNLGIKIFAYDLFAMLFIVAFVFHLFIKRAPVARMDRGLKIFMFLLFLFWLFKVLSGLGVLTYSLRGDAFTNLAQTQYLKGVIKDLFFLICFVCIAAFMSNLTRRQREKVILMFIYGVLASCIYQYITLIAMVQFNTDIDQIIWPAISLGAPREINGVSAQIYGSGGITFYRAGGLSLAPNNLAAQLVCVIPFMILFALHRRKSFVFIAVMATISIVITVSRSGMLALFCALLLLLFGNFNRFIKTFKIPLLMVLVLLLVAGYMHGDKLLWIIETRVDMSGKGFSMGLRGDLNVIAADLIANYPLFGVGNLNSPIQLMHYQDIVLTTGTDLHSYWMTKLVELGLPAFLFILFFFGYIFTQGLRHKNLYGKALAYSLFGLIIAGFFNNNLSTFPLQFFIFIFFCASILEYRDDKAQQRRAMQQQIPPNAKPKPLAEV